MIKSGSYSFIEDNKGVQPSVSSLNIALIYDDTGVVETTVFVIFDRVETTFDILYSHERGLL